MPDPMWPFATELMRWTALSVAPVPVLYCPKVNVNFASQLSIDVNAYLPLGLSVAAFAMATWLRTSMTAVKGAVIDRSIESPICPKQLRRDSPICGSQRALFGGVVDA